ncbi:MAG: preprotein translocase subunit SecE [Lachnospiraceae bacterium]|nr:preprotein translocase subunit SecE [Lachnospiraceae bacterium]
MAEKSNSTEKAKAKENKPSFWSGVKREWSKIIWPTKEDVLKESGLVIVMSLILGVVITVIDSGALQAVNWLLAR